MYMSGKITDIFHIRVQRQHAVTQKHGIVQIIGNKLNPIGGIAFNGLEFCRFYFCGFQDFIDNAYMVGKVILLVPVEEDQITGNGNIFLCGSVKIQLRQLFDPGSDTVIIGHSLYPGIFQTEGSEHGTPVSVGNTVPCTITGIAVPGFIFPHCIIAGAFRVTKLTFRNCNYICVPVFCQLHIFHGGFPELTGFHIRIRIGIALGGMLMFLDHTDLLIAAVCMFMVFTANGICVNQNCLKAVCAMRMAGCRRLFAHQFRFLLFQLSLFQTANILPVPLIAGIPMGMSVRFRNLTVQLLLITGIRVDMIDLQCADQLWRTIAGFHMFVHFPINFAAIQNSLIAGSIVAMAFLDGTDRSGFIAGIGMSVNSSAAG